MVKIFSLFLDEAGGLVLECLQNSNISSPLVWSQLRIGQRWLTESDTCNKGHIDTCNKKQAHAYYIKTGENASWVSCQTQANMAAAIKKNRAMKCF